MKKTAKIDPQEYKPRTPEVIKSLLFEPQWLDLLKGRNNQYEEILSHLQLLSKKYLSNEVCDYSAKGISKIFCLNETLIAKRIHLIYNDLLELNRKEPKLFKREGTRCNLDFYSMKQHVYFTLWLNAIPRELDHFFFNFIRGKIANPFFTVKKIYHEHTDGEQIVTICLDMNSDNFYRKFLCDKAIFYEKISPSDVYIEDYDLDKRLKRIYPEMK